MNPRERMLAILVGGAVGLVMVYQAVNFVFIKPMVRAQVEQEELEREIERLDGVIRSRKYLAQRWLTHTSHTLSFNRADASNRFGQDLKQLAERHGFDNALFTPITGSKLGSRTDITTVGYRVVAEGRYPKVLAFLRDLYRTPYLSAVTRLSIMPAQQRSRAFDEVKMEFTIETPVLPVIDKKDIQEVASAATLPEDVALDGTPVRDFVRSDEEFALLDRRNIFKPYIPPPQNVVMLTNDDWKTVAAKVRFYWEGEVHESKAQVIGSKAQQSVSGFGDIVEIEGSYADGKTFGPQRLDFNTRQDWTYTIPAHHPPPPPDVVAFAVDNKDKNPVDFTVVLTFEDGKTKTYPPMRIQPGTVLDVDEFKVRSLSVSATYASGKPVNPATFNPRKEKQTYTIPPEPAEAVVHTPQPVSDPPADGQYTVSGLVTYRGTHELVATAAGNKRTVFVAGEEGQIDGGKLLGIHPLGGVVKMPSGNYYLYPLGKKFTDRVKLEATHEEELPAAIDAWVFSMK